MQTISAESLKQKLDAGESPVLLDVREAWEYDICRIPDSINISMSNVDKMLNDLKPEDETIVICHHGMRSFQVANFLQEKGFNQVVNLEGGVDAWAKSVDPDMEQY